METGGLALRGVCEVGGGVGARPEPGAALVRACAVAESVAGSATLALAVVLVWVWVLAARDCDLETAAVAPDSLSWCRGWRLKDGGGPVVLAAPTGCSCTGALQQNKN